MAKLPVIQLLCSVVVLVTMPVVHSLAEGPKEAEEWFQNLNYAKEKVTNLHFYFHDVLSGQNPTAVLVVRPNITVNSPTAFGSIFMMDDLLTVGPEPTSEIVGRAQGLYGSAGLEEFDLLLTFNFVFTEGKYNGSTLSVLGRTSVPDKHREMPIVGGSGFFRLARGIAMANLYMLNTTTDFLSQRVKLSLSSLLWSIYELNVTVNLFLCRLPLKNVICIDSQECVDPVRPTYYPDA